MIAEILADAKKLHDDLAAARAEAVKLKLNPARLTVAIGNIRCAVDNLLVHAEQNKPAAPEPPKPPAPAPPEN